MPLDVTDGVLPDEVSLPSPTTKSFAAIGSYRVPRPWSRAERQGPRRARPRGGTMSGATMVDLSEAVCPSDPCPAIVEGIILY